MRIPTPTFIFGFGLLAIISGALLIGGALYLGLRRKWTLLDWRITKLASALLGSVGILMLLLNFEKSVHDSLIEKGKALSYQEYVDTKLFILQNLIIACTKDEADKQNARACSDYRSIDGQVQSVYVRNSFKVGPFEPSKYSSEIKEFILELNRRLEMVNFTLPPANEDKEMVSTDTRLHLLMLGVLLVTLAIAGSVGEAAFQVRLVLDEQRSQPVV
jgi:hypothetical protein